MTKWRNGQARVAMRGKEAPPGEGLSTTSQSGTSGTEKTEESASETEMPECLTEFPNFAEESTRNQREHRIKRRRIGGIR